VLAEALLFFRIGCLGGSSEMVESKFGFIYYMGGTFTL
jgi:hypothetical protein